mgnify:CR=1 FL=1|tara:strand:+ start:1086 stop:1559 length:474 start_codon:yes stop_codon:yes gene_type:complete
MNATTFLDAEESSGFVQGLSFREIVLNYIKVIGALSKVEMRGGYWYEKTLNTSGATTKLWMEDTRESYVNSIKYLSDILYPHFDEKMIMFFSRQEQLIKERKGSALDKITSSEDNKNDIAQDWRRINVDLHRDIFREINCFLYRSNYLESKIVEDEI